MGWVCIFEQEEFPKSQRKLYWVWILFQFGAGKTEQHFAASIIMYIYLAKEESPMLQVEYAVRVQKAGSGPGG